MVSLASLLTEVRTCSICAGHLPFGPRPVLQLHGAARILIAGQAPGRKVHESGVPFSDASGEHLRDWLGLSGAEFYDPRQVAILARNPWFERKLIPVLRRRVREVLQSDG